MRLLIITFIFIIVTGCTSGASSPTNPEDMKIVCLDGVEYYLFKEHVPYSGYGYMSVKFNPDSTVSTC